MTASLGRALVSLIVTPCLALSAIVVPEHVHEADADHPKQAIHRHVQPHAPGSHDDEHPALADDDDHVVWLERLAVGQSGFQRTPRAFASSAPFEIAPAAADVVAPPDVVTASAHGPPKAPASPRAPPFFTV